MYREDQCRPRYASGILVPIGLCFWLVLLACGGEPESPPVRPDPLPKVVSLSPMATESFILMGWANALMAVDSESARRGELGHLPGVELADCIALAPDLVIVPALREDDRHLADALRASGSDVIEFAPHDFDDAYELWRRLGALLGRENAAHRAVRDHSRELAEMSAAAYGYRRPRVAAVVGLTPLEVAGGHSFTTDLIEIAGAESVTHGSEERQIVMTPAELRATAPDLVLVIQPTRPSTATQSRIRAMLGEEHAIAFLAFDRQRFWLKQAVETARQVRSHIQPRVMGRRLDTPTKAR